VKAVREKEVKLREKLALFKRSLSSNILARYCKIY